VGIGALKGTCTGVFGVISVGADGIFTGIGEFGEFIVGVETIGDGWVKGAEVGPLSFLPNNNDQKPTNKSQTLEKMDICLNQILIQSPSDTMIPPFDF
jgi:hypothetical protein